MRSHGKGSLSATTQVKEFSPEIIHIALGQGFHFLETNTELHVNGECIFGVPGSQTVAGKRTVYIGTWENRYVPKGSCQEAGKVTRQYDVSVVGLTHSRGVGSVMAAASYKTLEGVSSLMQREEIGYAIH